MVEEWTTCMRLLSWRRHQGTMLKNCVLILPVSDPAKQAAQIVKHHYRLKTVDRRRPMRHVIPIFLIIMFIWKHLIQFFVFVFCVGHSSSIRSFKICSIGFNPDDFSQIKAWHQCSAAEKKIVDTTGMCVRGFVLSDLLLLKRKTGQCNNSHFCHVADKSQSPSLIGHDCAVLIEYLHIRNSNKSK